MERKLKASEALSVEREPDGIKISNNTDQWARVQVTFVRRSKVVSDHLNLYFFEGSPENINISASAP